MDRNVQEQAVWAFVLVVGLGIVAAMGYRGCQVTEETERQRLDIVAKCVEATKNPLECRRALKKELR